MRLAAPKLFPQIEAAVPAKNGNNKLSENDRAAHDWYRFVLSFPPHLVREYLDRFGVTPGSRVLDPFCGTGTTLVECKKLGIPSVGVEANPVACFASRVKTDWGVDPDGLLAHAQAVSERVRKKLAASGVGDGDDLVPGARISPTLLTLPEESVKLLLRNSISPLPLHKTLLLLDDLRRHADESFRQIELLALAKALVGPVGNLHFGPEVGVGKIKADAPVVQCWLDNVAAMVRDLRGLAARKDVFADLHCADSRLLLEALEPQSVDAVITSPPYPNEKDYTRTTRLESVLLGFIHSRAELREFKQALVRSNTRNVYKGDTDDEWIEGHPEIARIAAAIEARRIELGKTSGFERLYARVTKLYFGGMARHLADLRTILRPGAQLAYVVGDQASYLRVMIRTGQLLAQIAEGLGYELVGIDLFRTRLATATRQQLREEVVLLRWPGSSKKTLSCKRSPRRF